MSSIGIDAVSTRPVGLHYYPSGLRRYVSRLGLNMAKRAFLTAQALRCEQLNELGLFEQLLAPDEFDAALGAWTQRLAQLALLAVQATKQSLNEIAAGHFDESTLPAPRVGEHTTAVLGVFGFAQSEIDDLKQLGVIAQG